MLKHDNILHNIWNMKTCSLAIKDIYNYIYVYIYQQVYSVFGVFGEQPAEVLLNLLNSDSQSYGA